MLLMINNNMCFQGEIIKLHVFIKLLGYPSLTDIKNYLCYYKD